MADYDDFLTAIHALLGDTGAASQYDTTELHRCLKLALARYGSAFERVEPQICTCGGGGLYGIMIEGWTGNRLSEIAYLHWPAAVTIDLVTTENKILEWWYYQGDPSAEILRVDVQISGSTRPADNDRILVYGVTQHEITGMTSDDAAVPSTITTVPVTHWNTVIMGAAGYALRGREASLALGITGTVFSKTEFTTPYHVGVLADLAEKMLSDFERDLAEIRKKRLDRPPWGPTERKRLRRIEGDKS